MPILKGPSQAKTVGIPAVPQHILSIAQNWGALLAIKNSFYLITKTVQLIILVFFTFNYLLIDA